MQNKYMIKQSIPIQHLQECFTWFQAKKLKEGQEDVEDYESESDDDSDIEDLMDIKVCKQVREIWMILNLNDI